MTLRRWASDSSCFEGARCLHIRESIVHQHCPGDAFIYCILHDVYWMMLSAVPTLQRRLINWKTYASGHCVICGIIPTFFRGTWKTTRKEVFHVKQLWARNYNCVSQIRRSALILQLLTWQQNAFIQTFTHTYIPLIQHSSIDRRMWNTSDTMGCSTQLGQRNILNKSIYKIYVGETLK